MLLVLFLRNNYKCFVSLPKKMKIRGNSLKINWGDDGGVVLHGESDFLGPDPLTPQNFWPSWAQCLPRLKFGVKGDQGRGAKILGVRGSGPKKSDSPCKTTPSGWSYRKFCPWGCGGHIFLIIISPINF